MSEDRIQIKGMKFFGRHGVTEDEQSLGQRIEVDVEVEVDPSRFRPFDVDNLVCNYDRANRLLGWKPEVSISEGLKQTIEWIKHNDISFNAPFKGWTSSYRNGKNNG